MICTILFLLTFFSSQVKDILKNKFIISKKKKRTITFTLLIVQMDFFFVFSIPSFDLLIKPNDLSCSGNILFNI